MVSFKSGPLEMSKDDIEDKGKKSLTNQLLRRTLLTSDLISPKINPSVHHQGCLVFVLFVYPPRRWITTQFN